MRLCLSCLMLLPGPLGHAQDSVSMAGKLDEYLLSAVRYQTFNGTVLIAKADSIILAKGYGWKNYESRQQNDINTIYQIGSITKPFTAEVVLRLVEEKKLSLGDRLDQFFPGYTHAHQITIQDLLGHNSGIPNYDVEESDTIAWSPVKKDTVLSLFMTRPLDFKPGTRYKYSNSGYYLLGLIIEKVTGMPYEEAVRKMIFEPLQMSQSGFDFMSLKSSDKATGYAQLDSVVQRPAHLIDSTVSYAAGSMHTNASDLFRWMRSMAKRQILSPRMWEKAQTPVLWKYGYGWFVDHMSGQAYVGHSGGIMGFTAYVMYFPASDITMILLNNVMNEATPVGLPVQDLSAILFNQPYHLVGPELKISAGDSILNKYIGQYALTSAPKRKMLIDMQGGHLVAHVSGANLELVFQTRTTFRFRGVPDADGEFIIENGVVSKISITQNGHYEWNKVR